MTPPLLSTRMDSGVFTYHWLPSVGTLRLFMPPGKSERPTMFSPPALIGTLGHSQASLPPDLHNSVLPEIISGAYECSGLS